MVRKMMPTIERSDHQRVVHERDGEPVYEQCDDCGVQWPCPTIQLLDRAEAAETHAARLAVYVQHDINNCGEQHCAVCGLYRVMLAPPTIRYVALYRAEQALIDAVLAHADAEEAADDAGTAADVSDEDFVALTERVEQAEEDMFAAIEALRELRRE